MDKKSKLLTYNLDTWTEEELREAYQTKQRADFVKIALLIATGIILVVVLHTMGYADTIVVKQDNIAGYSVNQWCNAIYKAEGGQKTRHPYGILAHYKHTTPRQACINTIKSKYKAYKLSGLKTPFLASKYCPVGCSNDRGTNQYWIKNVSFYLKQGA